MNKKWKSEARSMAMFCGIGALVGALIGQIFLCISIVLICYSVWNIINLKSIDDWLSDKARDEEFNDEEPPEAKGIWGEIFDHLYHYQRREKLARNELQSIIDRAQDSTNALKDGVISTDSHGNLEWWNESTCRLLGFRYPDDVGQAITNLFRDPRFKNYFEVKDYSEPLVIPSPVNEHVILQIHATLFGQEDRLLLIRDISRLHNLEKMRTDFVANVSHELRTPLTVLKGYLETLIDQSSLSPKLMAKAANQMMDQSLRMESLVNDLLLLSRLETKVKEEDQSIGVHPILTNLCDHAQTLAKKNNQEITLLSTDNLQIMGIEKELHSAFSNLINNAVKYSGEEGSIQVRWWEDQDGAHMQVEDNGIGIDPEHIPRLTERFYRVDSSRHTSTGGTGLGLAIVKHVMMRHGGTLEIQSEYGKGSVFSCHFPKERIRYKNLEESRPQPELKLVKFTSDDVNSA